MRVAFGHARRNLYTARFELQVKQTPQRKASSTASAEVKRIKIRAFLVGGSFERAGEVDAELAALIIISAFAELAAPELITELLAAADEMLLLEQAAGLPPSPWLSVLDILEGR